MSSTPPEFRFECTQCGACCRRPGEVRFDDETFERMSDAMGKTLEEFRLEFQLDYLEGRKEPWFFVVTTTDPCPMLEGDLCRVHDVRPRQCRTYPFWPETTSASDWNLEKQHCPGIGLGQPWPRKLVRQIIDEEAEGSDPT